MGGGERGLNVDMRELWAFLGVRARHQQAQGTSLPSRCEVRAPWVPVLTARLSQTLGGFQVGEPPVPRISFLWLL